MQQQFDRELCDIVSILLLSASPRGLIAWEAMHAERQNLQSPTKGEYNATCGAWPPADDSPGT